ncbi:antirestriction protein ArdR [Salmonella enterica]|nr:antirestriction protein ArdR [Salmonella enterica]
MLLELLMFDYRNSDQERYGQQIYHHFRKQGNHRWDTTVHQDNDGKYAVIFRHSFSKKQADGVKRTMIRDETVIRAGSAQELTEATFPAFQDSDILKASDFFESLKNSNI